MRFKATIAYILLIILINSLFFAVPTFNILGSIVSPMDATVGSVYVLRDLAQRELGHYVIFAMLVGAGASYFTASHTVAIASVSAFSIGESIDWLIYSFTGWPLSRRILLSSAISSPIDSCVFLYLVHQFNILGVMVMTFAKLIGVIALWYWWKKQKNSPNPIKK